MQVIIQRAARNVLPVVGLLPSGAKTRAGDERIDVENDIERGPPLSSRLLRVSMNKVLASILDTAICCDYKVQPLMQSRNSTHLARGFSRFKDCSSLKWQRWFPLCCSLSLKHIKQSWLNLARGVCLLCNKKPKHVPSM